MQISQETIKLTQNRGRTLPVVEGRIEQLKLLLPEDHKPYTDKYFLRTNEILKKEGLNPWVRAQVFLRGGPGEIRGIDEAIAIIDKYSKIREHGGRVYAKNEGDNFDSLESVMIIEAPVQDIMELETMYLGVIAGETRKALLGVEHIDLDAVTEKMREIKNLVGEGIPVYYLGARHARWDEDALISKAAFAGGAAGASTDIGAIEGGQVGMGTIPHALENILAWKYGREEGVRLASVLFDKHIDPKVPRIALVDYNNREVTDSLKTARSLNDKLFGVRVDTCGENVAQNAFARKEDIPENHSLKDIVDLIPEKDLKYWFGRGVSVSGVYALRKALNNTGYEKVKNILTSGFGSAEKTEAFVRAQRLLKDKLGGSKLFDQLGVGKIFPSCTSTMDIVAVSDDPDSLDSNLISKIGRPARPNPTLELRLGGEK